MTKRMFVTVVFVSVISGGLVVVTNAFAQTNGQNNISLKYLRPFGPGIGRFGKLHPSLTPAPTQ